jgi:hypothetical protein
MQYEMCLIKTLASTTTALLLQNPLDKAMEISELPRLLDKLVKALEAVRFLSENLDAMEVTHKGTSGDFRID